MKYIALLILVLGMAIGASAQATINFGDLPDVSSPTPLPNGYGGVNWSGVFYVDPFEWPGADKGFKHNRDTAGRDVAFTGYLCVSNACYASISSQDGKAFLLTEAHVAAGYSNKLPSPLVVLAYNHGQYMGTQTFLLTSDLQELDFPPSWGGVTQVVFEGSVVFYDLTLYLTP